MEESEEEKRRHEEFMKEWKSLEIELNNNIKLEILMKNIANSKEYDIPNNKLMSMLNNIEYDIPNNKLMSTLNRYYNDNPVYLEIFNFFDKYDLLSKIHSYNDMKFNSNKNEYKSENCYNIYMSAINHYNIFNKRPLTDLSSSLLCYLYKLLEHRNFKLSEDKWEKTTLDLNNQENIDNMEKLFKFYTVNLEIIANEIQIKIKNEIIRRLLNNGNYIKVEKTNTLGGKSHHRKKSKSRSKSRKRSKSRGKSKRK